MLTPYLSFDELHVVSDLHLGGDGPKRQIFGSTQALKALVDQLAAEPPERRIALAINGDFIDFLAEQPGTYFDPEGATAKLDRIFGDPSFAPVFAALSRFVASKGRTLLINLGNHDLELSLPWVREHLVSKICGADEAAHARLRVFSDGGGVPCNVGNATVLLVHGNEVDTWNVADFERIRRIGRDLQFGKSVEAWTPNAGTKLVIDVMNGIKSRFPFVDLLKPENAAVVPALLAIDPSLTEKASGAAAIVGRRSFDSLRRAVGFLSNQDLEDELEVAEPASFTVRSPSVPRAAQAELLIDQVEKEMRDETEPMALLQGSGYAQLGLVGAGWGLLKGRPKHEVLRVALDGLDTDRTFDFFTSDKTFEALDEWVSPSIDYVIAGHTHLERALRRKSGRGFYYNSGTWARLLQITKEIRQDAAAFERLFRLLEGGSLLDLDAEPGLVLKRCSVVSVVSRAGWPVFGELRHVTEGETGFSVVPVPSTRFEKA